nr:hypothetical protein HK105_002181 [Polyrhizophydium stewartii]
MTLKDYLRFELRTRVYDDPIFSGVPSEQVLAAKLHANPYFPFTYIGQGETVGYRFRHIHRYILYPNEYQYEFASGDYIHVRGDFSNIYVRLLRETAESSQRSRMYYLVLNGYEMDRQILCSPTRNLEELRKLGQRIASNLNINYFDEANISKHHVIRHFR